MSPKSPPIYLSIVIPVYNETSRLFNLPIIYQHFTAQPYSFELIVINDGSQDQTLKQLKQLQAKINFSLLSYRHNRGKGYAIKQGMIAAKGQYILFMDVDLSTPLEMFQKFLPHLAKYDIIIGSRKRHGSKLKQHQSKLRETLGKYFTFISKLALQLEVSDFTCGFKCFNRQSAQHIFPRVTIDRWGFDSEVLFIAQKHHFKIKEVPVTWTNSPLTKVKFPNDIINTLLELAKIRLNDLKRLYEN